MPNVSVVSTEPNRASFAPRTLMKAGSSLRASRNGAAVLTQEQLATLLASYKTPEQAQGEYNVYVIEEVTPAYTLTSGENWKKTIDDLPRHETSIPTMLLKLRLQQATSRLMRARTAA